MTKIDLVWSTEKRKVDDLLPFEKNPRQITEKQIEDLKKSLEKFNLVELPVIDTNGRIIAGHQRMKVMQLIGRGQEEVEVRVPNRELTEQEVAEYNIRSNKNTGGWDFDILANDFEIQDLVDWGFEKYEVFANNEDAKFDFDDLPEVDLMGEGGDIKNILILFYFERPDDAEKVKNLFDSGSKTIDGKLLMEKLGI